MEAPYFTAIRIIVMVSGTVAQWECVWGQRFTAACCGRRPLCLSCNGIIGKNERQLSGLIIGNQVLVIHRVRRSKDRKQ